MPQHKCHLCLNLLPTFPTGELWPLGTGQLTRPEPEDVFFVTQSGPAGDGTHGEEIPTRPRPIPPEARSSFKSGWMSPRVLDSTMSPITTRPRTQPKSTGGTHNPRSGASGHEKMFRRFYIVFANTFRFNKTGRYVLQKFSQYTCHNLRENSLYTNLFFSPLARFFPPPPPPPGEPWKQRPYLPMGTLRDQLICPTAPLLLHSHKCHSHHCCIRSPDRLANKTPDSFATKCADFIASRRQISRQNGVSFVRQAYLFETCDSAVCWLISSQAGNSTLQLLYCCHAKATQKVLIDRD